MIGGTNYPIGEYYFVFNEYDDEFQSGEVFDQEKEDYLHNGNEKLMKEIVPDMNIIFPFKTLALTSKYHLPHLYQNYIDHARTQWKN